MTILFCLGIFVKQTHLPFQKQIHVYELRLSECHTVYLQVNEAQRENIILSTAVALQ
jgi:hypothetical protein